MAGMSDANRRLVRKFMVPKYELFNAVARKQFSAVVVENVAGPIARKAEACDGCVDKSFTRVWIPRLRSARTSRRAHGFLRRGVAKFAVQGGRVERRHLVGQSIKRARTRGHAPTCSEMGKVTHTHHAQLRHAAKANGVVENTLQTKTNLRIRHRFACNLPGLQLGVNAQRSKKRVREVCGLADPRKRRGIARGYDMYRCSTLGSRHPDPDVLKELNESWKKLPLARRLVYISEAAAENRTVAKLMSLDFLELCDVGVEFTSLRDSRRTLVKRQCVLNSLAKMQNHPAWRGLGEVVVTLGDICNTVSLYQLQSLREPRQPRDEDSKLFPGGRVTFGRWMAFQVVPTVIANINVSLGHIAIDPN